MNRHAHHIPLRLLALLAALMLTAALKAAPAGCPAKGEEWSDGVRPDTLQEERIAADNAPARSSQEVKALRVSSPARISQEEGLQADTAPADTLVAQQVTPDLLLADSLVAAVSDSLTAGEGRFIGDTLSVKPRRDWSTWRPNPQRALWLALVIPGAGQIYNRKYWKLPIVYGGIMGCLYAMNWNNMMYKDYSQAYLDIMDSDPTTQSYNKFLHLGKQITSANEERYKTIFKNRKDKFRRWRDLSFFCLLGVYALSVIDAYVDAELSEFDISKDLSLKVQPAVMGTRGAHSVLSASAVGVNCQLNF